MVTKLPSYQSAEFRQAVRAAVAEILRDFADGEALTRSSTSRHGLASAALGTAAYEDGSAFATDPHTHDAAAVTSGTVATARLGSGTADSTTFLRGDGAWTTPATRIYRVPIHAHGSAALGLTNMAAAEDWLGNSRIATIVDLANYSQCRLVVRLVSTSASANSPRLRVRYKTGAYSSTITNYSDIGTSEVAVALDQSSGLYSSGWVDLAAGAQVDDVNLAVTEIGGDGVADPSVGSVAVEFR